MPLKSVPMQDQRPTCKHCRLPMAFAGTADDAAWCSSCGRLALLTDTGWGFLLPHIAGAEYFDAQVVSLVEHDEELVALTLRLDAVDEWRIEIRLPIEAENVPHYAPLLTYGSVGIRIKPQPLLQKEAEEKEGTSL